MIKVVLLLFHSSVQLLLLNSFFEFDRKKSSLKSPESSGSKSDYLQNSWIQRLVTYLFEIINPGGAGNLEY